MRKFYVYYPNFQTVSGKLSWSHICELLKVDDELERSFYERECIAEHWSLRALRRQKRCSTSVAYAILSERLKFPPCYCLFIKNCRNGVFSCQILLKFAQKGSKTDDI